MSDNKLYTGNLPYSMTSAALKELFAPYGEVVSANIVIDRATGRSRGFGFVEMSTEDFAKAALEALNGKSLEGRQIVINFARPRTDRPERSERSDRPPRRFDRDDRDDRRRY